MSMIIFKWLQGLNDVLAKYCWFLLFVFMILVYLKLDGLSKSVINEIQYSRQVVMGGGLIQGGVSLDDLKNTLDRLEGELGEIKRNTKK